VPPLVTDTLVTVQIRVEKPSDVSLQDLQPGEKRAKRKKYTQLSKELQTAQKSYNYSLGQE